MGNATAGRNIVAIMVLMVVVTNRFAGTHESNDRLFDVTDIRSYTKIADAAPGLPAVLPNVPFPYHHGQRLAVPYLAGLLARATGMSSYWGMYCLALGCAAGTVLLCLRISRRLQLPPFPGLVFISMLLMNPWLLRQDISVPGMLPDIAFNFFVLLLGYGLIVSSAGLIFLSVVLAAAARQTALVVLPALMLWAVQADGRALRRRRLAWMAGAMAAAVGIYLVTGRLAASFSIRSENLHHVLGLLSWIRDSFSLTRLVSHLATPLLSLGVALSLLAGTLSVRRPREDASPRGAGVTVWLVLAACLLAQPLLAGPAVTKGACPRLCVSAVIPLAIAWAIRVREFRLLSPPPPPRHCAIWLSLLFLGSLDYTYSAIPTLLPAYGWDGPYGRVCYALLLLIIMVTLGLWMHRLAANVRHVPSGCPASS